MPGIPLTTHVALLRGINVGGKNRLPMQGLSGIFLDAGCGEVQTYLQSGNVIFRAARKVLNGLDGRVTNQIEQRFGLRIPVILRTAEELAETVANNPFATAEADENALHVFFLAALPEAQNLAKLDPQRSPPDTFLLRHREIYAHMPNGMGRTKLSNAYFDAKLATISTARNWRTVLALHQRMGASRS